MGKQYPPSPEARRALARYVVNDLQVNPMTDLIPRLLGTLKVSEDNGMLTVSNGADGGTLTFPESLANAAVPKELSETAFVRFAIHCVTLAAPLPVAAAFLQAEHMARPTSLLCSGMWQWLAYLHAAPQAVCTALRCLRPDMIQAVQHMYGGWLRQCRAPRHIASVLEDLADATWRLRSGSPACRVVTSLVNAAQVAAVPAKSVSGADIVVDDRAGVFVSRRDKCFMALALACGPDKDLAFRDIKAFSDAKARTPQAFEELPQGAHPLDELP